MNQWLQNFAYRIDVGLGTLLFVGVITMIVAFATVSVLSFRAARTNPVEALRYE